MYHSEPFLKSTAYVFDCDVEVLNKYLHDYGITSFTLSLTSDGVGIINYFSNNLEPLRRALCMHNRVKRLDKPAQILSSLVNREDIDGGYI